MPSRFSLVLLALSAAVTLYGVFLLWWLVSFLALVAGGGA